MKIIHIESGLGNQMLSYCEYLAIKKANPSEECYIETIVYDIPECNDIICQWNGYELQRIYGINAPNVSDLCSSKKWDKIVNEVKESQFWNKHWNYPVWITNALNSNGFNVKNIRGDFDNADLVKKFYGKKSIRTMFADTIIGNYVKRHYKIIFRNKYIQQESQPGLLFYKSDEDIFTGQRLSFKYIGNNIELIDEEIRESFQFPKIDDSKNLEMLRIIQENESVAIHARRGDLLGYNGECYKYGYFKRAVQYIKKNVQNPVFIFFCDPGSVEWCKENESVFGLDFTKDNVLFTDWNKGLDSYRDMQLMTECKHNIITNSSFGWWGAYLNSNPNKITCSPYVAINTTHHF